MPDGDYGCARREAGPGVMGTMAQRVYRIPLKHVKLSEHNVRRRISEEGIAELADSIDTLGLLQPVLLRGKYGSPPYELIVGQRRFRAHKHLGRTKIEATFAGETDDTGVKIRSLVENVVRKELNHADIAEAVTDLYRRFDRDEQKVVKATALTLTMVRKYVHVQEFASPHMKELLAERKISLDDIKRALRSAQYQIEKAEQLLDLMVERQLTTHQKARLPEEGEDNPDASPEELIAKAEEPRVETQILVRVPDAVRQALGNAARALEMTEAELAAQAVQEWLLEKGFIDEQQAMQVEGSA